MHVLLPSNTTMHVIYSRDAGLVRGSIGQEDDHARLLEKMCDPVWFEARVLSVLAKSVTETQESINTN